MALSEHAPTLTYIILAVGAVFAASLVATRITLKALLKRAILDHPNERSSHSAPTPRGGGIAVIVVVLAAWAVIGPGSGDSGVGFWALLGATSALAAVSWVDDLRGLNVFIRLAVHGLLAGAALIALPAPGPYFGTLLPPVVDLTAAWLLWVWFINLFNFMDGIDGISGVETASIGIGVALVVFAIDLDSSRALYGLTIAAAALGFLWWNWHPAKIFLGDVGSVPLGFLLGWLLLDLSARGHWMAALIIPLYYLVDATLTLIRRAVRGEQVWQAHRQHFYQMGVHNGLSHSAVAVSVGLVNLFLVALAVLTAMGWGWRSLPGAFMIVFGLLLFLTSVRSRGPS